MTDPTAMAVHVIVGLAALLFGRRLFWLFVAAVGFVTAFAFVPTALPGRAPWIVWSIALVAGLVGALLAVSLQYFAAALAGFAAGAYVSVPLALGLGGAPWLPLLCGILGAVLMVVVFDWALIALSALTGARALVDVSGLEGLAALALWAVLAGIGMAVQASFLAPAVPLRGHR